MISVISLNPLSTNCICACALRTFLSNYTLDNFPSNLLIEKQNFKKIITLNKNDSMF